MKIVMVHNCAYTGYELRRELLRRVFIVDHLFFSSPAKIATIKITLKLRRLKCTLVHADFCMHLERDMTARMVRSFEVTAFIQLRFSMELSIYRKKICISAK